MSDKLWILTEERPKASVIKQILDLYVRDFKGKLENLSQIKIKPVINDGIFAFRYIIEGIKLKGIEEVVIKTVSGNSSFLDFLVFQQEEEPKEDGKNKLLMAIEETKTNDDESRNTGVYQRASKFVFITSYCKDVKLYMLYNDELQAREQKKPSDTSIFGTNMLLTIGVDIVGKDTSRWFNSFSSLNEMITFKAGMRRPPVGNVPIDISVFDDRIEISGRLAKPADAGNIGHDPNIGALSIISKCLRKLGWKKDIIITKHGVLQSYVNHTQGRNKFLYICNILNLKLDKIEMPPKASLPDQYWYYEMDSEKMATILLHIVGEYYGLRGIYENHAGCERGYFKTSSNLLIPLPKKDINDVNLYIPDLVLHDPKTNIITLIEGKKLSTIKAGIEEIKYYDSIETEFIKPYYPSCTIYRWVTIFGGNLNNLPDDRILLYLNKSGKIIINPKAPECIKQAFRKEGVSI